MANQTKLTKEQTAWLFAWTKKIEDISRMWAGSCMAYTRQGEEYIKDLEKLAVKIARNS